MLVQALVAELAVERWRFLLLWALKLNQKRLFFWLLNVVAPTPTQQG
jgi:hypothetical protein